MNDPRASFYHRHRFPAELIPEAVWFYFRFPLSFRMVEDMLAYRGMIVTDKTIREWAGRFGRDYANTIRRRAVDQDGFVLEVLVQKRRDTKAAKRFIRKLLTCQGVSPRVMITNKLGSYGAAKRAIGLTICDHRKYKGLNNRAVNSHQPIRRRERVMKRFESARHSQRFCSIHDLIYNHHYFQRNHLGLADHRELRQTATNMWREIACRKSA